VKLGYLRKATKMIAFTGINIEPEATRARLQATAIAQHMYNISGGKVKREGWSNHDLVFFTKLNRGLVVWRALEKGAGSPSPLQIANLQANKMSIFVP